jgi:hypothetical protein
MLDAGLGASEECRSHDLDGHGALRGQRHVSEFRDRSRKYRFGRRSDRTGDHVRVDRSVEVGVDASSQETRQHSDSEDYQLLLSMSLSNLDTLLNREYLTHCSFTLFSASLCSETTRSKNAYL